MSLVGPRSARGRPWLVRGCQADRDTPSLARSGYAAVRTPGRAWSASLTSPPGHRGQAVEEVGVEAYIPAQQPPSCPQARLSRPNEHPRRARRAQEPARQGPRSPVGLTNRIRGRDAFERLRRDGTRIHGPSLWCNFLSDPADGAVEHGVRDRTRLRFRRAPATDCAVDCGRLLPRASDGAAAAGPAADRRPAHRCRTDVRSASHGVRTDARIDRLRTARSSRRPTRAQTSAAARRSTAYQRAFDGRPSPCRFFPSCSELRPRGAPTPRHRPWTPPDGASPRPLPPVRSVRVRPGPRRHQPSESLIR